MKKMILITVFGHVVLMGGCKSAVRSTGYQPESFAAMPKIVRSFFKAAIKNDYASLGRNYDNVLEWAAEFGEYKVLKEVVEITKRNELLGWPNEFSEALYLAIKSHDVKKMDYLIEQGASVNEALQFAAKEGDINGIRYLTAKGAKDFDAAVGEAAKYRKGTTVQELVNLGANPNKGLAGAIVNGDFGMLEQLVALGADNFDEGLWLASLYGRLDMAKYTVKKGATDLNKALLGTVHVMPEGGNDHVAVMTYLLEKGATNIEEVLETVRTRIAGGFRTSESTESSAALNKMREILEKALATRGS